ncbi:Mbeg1-like protein [uncultured Psychroserpens sp.]|uniref:lipase family protein n=1 Tax=uncultured Psychroserpens sp. TaxID=255436 RepID=UPI0026338F4B|nr:lipase family protein [uncultured Psychroserpens sp.]
MGTIDHCRLLCASASAYLIQTTFKNGVYRKNLRPTLTKHPDNHNVINQYDAIKLLSDPFVVVGSPLKPNKFLKIEACFVGETAEGIIISFRGTLPPVPVDAQSIADWIENIFYADTKPYNPNAPGKVHEGFLDALIALETGILYALSQLDPNNTKPIYLTGHSKGGAMAPIAAMYFKAKNLFTANHVVTYAGPKPGNAVFAKNYNATFPNSTNYENYLDIVPFLPPSKNTIAVLDGIIPKSWTWLHKLLKAAEDWDYEPVSKVLYVTEDSKVVKPNPLLSAERLVKLAETLVSNPKLIGEAHHVSCDYRYMKGICAGNVCTY